MRHRKEQHVTEPETAPQIATPMSMSDSDDLTLLQRVSSSDEQAFVVLYQRYTPMLQRFLSRALWQTSLVDEVLNDVMLVLWQDARRFPTTVPLGAWLHGIARHKAYKALRRQEVADSVPERLKPTLSPAADPESVLLHNEQATQLSQELAAMTPTDRLFLEKLLYQGCSYQEMAEQTGTPLNTVKVKMMRARRRLVQRFGASAQEANAAA